LIEVGGEKYFSFPTLQQLRKATEEELRELGFGYRAKYLINTAKQVILSTHTTTTRVTRERMRRSN
jgi:3-methyladenine DNA glycosylase/8-oxoguanine DNA glycosylase